MTFREWWLEMMEGAESATEEQVADSGHCHEAAGFSGKSKG
jgi:hypothetical protein